MAVNLKRLHDLGARKIAVTTLQPLGCLPRMTILSSFQECNVTQNMAVSFHNLLLNQAVTKLKNETGRDSSYVFLDLYSAFTTVLQNKGEFSGIIINYSIHSINHACMKLQILIYKKQGI